MLAKHHVTPLPPPGMMKTKIWTSGTKDRTYAIVANRKGLWVVHLLGENDPLAESSTYVREGVGVRKLALYTKAGGKGKRGTCEREQRSAS